VHASCLNVFAEVHINVATGAVPEKHRCFYPEGHHLLMYDEQKEKVISDIGTWLSDLPELLAQKKSKDMQSANRR
jgi:hypothetical protein